jgi:hypothetical protein
LPRIEDCKFKLSISNKFQLDAQRHLSALEEADKQRLLNSGDINWSRSCAGKEMTSRKIQFFSPRFYRLIFLITCLMLISQIQEPDSLIISGGIILYTTTQKGFDHCHAYKIFPPPGAGWSILSENPSGLV